MRLVRNTLGLILAMSWFLTCSFSQSQADSSPVRISSIKVDVELVTVNAAVTDSQNRPVTGLEAQYFQLWEDKVEQHIDYFSEEEAALSIGVVFDVSGSMQERIAASRDAAVTFLRLGNKEDEYFLVEFSDAPRVTQDWTQDITKLQTHIIATHANGRTALYDAVYLGLNKLKTARNPRKALLMITDGGDNHSSYRASDIKEFLREQDVQIYAIGIGQDDHEFDYIDPYSGFWIPAPDNFGKDTIEEMTGASGGRAFFLKTIDQLQDICTTIARQLKTEYVIGYKSSNGTKDGKWRKIRLKLRLPKGLRDLEVRSRSGYYAGNGVTEGDAK